METVICYFCNVKSEDWRRNLFEVKSQHSGSPIAFFVNKFLGECQSHRSVSEESNCICVECLQKIEEYDWLCTMAKRFESELREVLLKTESSCSDTSNFQKIEEIDVNVDTRRNEFFSVKWEDSIRSPQNVESEQIIESFPNKAVYENVTNSTESRLENEINGDKDSDLEYESGEGGSDSDYTPETKSHKKVKMIRKPVIRTKLEAINTKSTRVGRPAECTYTCSECMAPFNTKRELILHSRWHRKQKLPKFRCPKCFYTLKDEVSFDEHVKLHEGKSQLECVLCQAQFSGKGGLSKHMQAHYGESKYQCELCGKLFIQSTELKLHMKFHLKIKTNKCPQCPMMFTTTSHLNRHLQTHRKEKPYECKTCGNRFGYKYNLTAHEQLHTQTNKTNVCTFCSAAFDRKSKLNKHLQKSHSIMLPHSSTDSQL